MSRSDSGARIIDAAVRLGTKAGPSALSVQGVADEAGVSKALVLYHFGAKTALLTAVATALGERSAGRVVDATRQPDVIVGWRALGAHECASRELALLAALQVEPAVAVDAVARVRSSREAAATLLAERMLSAFGLTPRVPPSFAGRLLLRELDALAITHARSAPDAADVHAEQDAVLLALLALGR